MLTETMDKTWDYKLTNLKLHKDGDEYYLEAKYDTECEKEKGILHIPKIPLRIADVPRVDVYEECNHDFIFYGYGRRTCEVDLGFGNIMLKGNGKNEPWFTYQVTEEKVEELTLEEIEQKLGYKVKIVSSEK
jgi:hypothetical protein